MPEGNGGQAGTTTLVIVCDCGYLVRGQIEAELLSNARNHIDEAHPEMAGTVSDKELLANAEQRPLA
jgi:predicted small metal-binding protein